MPTTNSKSKIPSIANFMRLKFEAIGSNKAKQLKAQRKRVFDSLGLLYILIKLHLLLAFLLAFLCKFVL